jgi:hypothetical protein
MSDYPNGADQGRIDDLAARLRRAYNGMNGANDQWRHVASVAYVHIGREVTKLTDALTALHIRATEQINNEDADRQYVLEGLLASIAALAGFNEDEEG